MTDVSTATYVVLSDLQVPWHDTLVLEDLVLPFIDALKPTGVVLNGDILDCYSISDFDKDPKNADWTLEREIEMTQGILKRLRRIERRHWLDGNHEHRWTRVQWRNGRLSTMFKSLPEALRLGDYGFTYGTYGAHVDLGKLRVTHGHLVSKHSAWTGKAHFDHYGSSVLVGHTHRLGAYYRTDLRGQHVAFENGCLCRLDPEYVQHPNWQQGFSVVKVFSGGLFSVQQVPVIDRKFLLYGDKEFRR